MIATPDSYASPWVQFEAGAIWRSSEENSVSALLVKLDPEHLRDTPLSSFQNTKLEQGDVLELLKKIKQALNLELGDDIVEHNFGHVWPDFEKLVSEIEFQDEENAGELEPQDPASVVEDKLEEFERYLAARESTLLTKINELSRDSASHGVAAGIYGQGPFATSTAREAAEILAAVNTDIGSISTKPNNAFLAGLGPPIETTGGIEALYSRTPQNAFDVVRNSSTSSKKKKQ